MTTESIDQLHLAEKSRTGIIDRFAKNRLLAILEHLPCGRLTLIDHGDMQVFGEAAENGLHAEIIIHHPSAYRDMMLGGSVGAGEAFMRGAWSTPNLVELIRLMSRNMAVTDQLDSRFPLAGWLLDKAYHFSNRNSVSGSKRNISAHYDLSNDFFSLFLDPTMMYSSAVYSDEAESLDSASVAKLERLCQMLQLCEDDHLLEIGTGWGGLAIHAAKNYGCRVTTTTISREQYEYACRRVEEEGLSDRITLLFEDYRQLRGSFDKLVSVEMIEAVGHEYYESYFRTCSAMLKPGGLMALQAITIPHKRYDSARREVDFIKRFIFPGGCLPSNVAINQNLHRYTDMEMVEMYEIGIDYANTLRDWRERFFDRIEEVRQLGFDDQFIRMWEFYLCYCEGGFRERVIGTGQYLFAKPAWGVDRIA